MFALCTNNETEMKLMKYLIKNEDELKEIITYGCSAHFPSKFTWIGSHISGSYEACSRSTEIFLQPPSTALMAEGEKWGDARNP